MPHLFLCGLPSKLGASGRIVAGAAMVKTSPKGVVCLGLAREHHWRRRARSNEQAFKWPRRSLRDSHTISLDAQGVSRQILLGQLEAENAALRGSVMDLVLQIEALRDVTNTRNVPPPSISSGRVGAARLVWQTRALFRGPRELWCAIVDLQRLS